MGAQGKIEDVKRTVLHACTHRDKHVGRSPLGHALTDIDQITDGVADRASSSSWWCAEFGVFSGNTLQLIREHTPKDVPVVGFDTFTGLPEDWREGFPAGTFGLNGIPAKFPGDTCLVKGLFQDTLPPFKRLVGSSPLRLLHIDCDLYSATACVLNALNDNIVPGTVIVFDELINYPGFEDHELLAFSEFVVRNDRGFKVVAVENENTEPVSILITR